MPLGGGFALRIRIQQALRQGGVGQRGRHQIDADSRREFRGQRPAEPLDSSFRRGDRGMERHPLRHRHGREEHDRGAAGLLERRQSRLDRLHGGEQVHLQVPEEIVRRQAVERLERDGPREIDEPGKRIRQILRPQIRGHRVEGQCLDPQSLQGLRGPGGGDQGLLLSLKDLGRRETDAAVAADEEDGRSHPGPCPRFPIRRGLDFRKSRKRRINPGGFQSPGRRGPDPSTRHGIGIDPDPPRSPGPPAPAPRGARRCRPGSPRT